MENVSVSVVICVKNEEKYIEDCVNSILRQSFPNFELIIIDDQSTDSTGDLIGRFNDERIKYFRNEKWLGISESRNQGLSHSKGDYVFFTDGDCVVPENWIKEGLKYFRNPDCVAIEGVIYYVSKDYQPSFSDHVMENRYGNKFMTGNMAYKKCVIDAVGGFDKRLTYHEDRDIALKLMKMGKIYFCPTMIVYHPRVVMSPKQLVKSAATIAKNRVYLFRKFKDKECLLGRIVFPINLIKIFCPPLIFAGLLAPDRFRDSNDFRLLPYFYVYLINERLQIWRTCIAERVFLL